MRLPFQIGASPGYDLNRHTSPLRASGGHFDTSDVAEVCEVRGDDEAAVFLVFSEKMC